MVSCFEQMERLCRHLKAEIFDFVGVNRRSREYKLETIRAAAAALATRGAAREQPAGGGLRLPARCYSQACHQRGRRRPARSRARQMKYSGARRASHTA